MILQEKGRAATPSPRPLSRSRCSASGGTELFSEKLRIPFASRLPLPTETKVESGTSQSKGGPYVNLSNSEFKNNHLTEMCCGNEGLVSEAHRLLYHST